MKLLTYFLLTRIIKVQMSNHQHQVSSYQTVENF